MSSPSAGTIGPGTTLAGRYRLEDLLADSDGARFWRATDTVLARPVAVHAVPSEDDRVPGLLEAARLSATVNDSHLLRVLDVDDAEGVCWVVHEWGEGLSLDLMLQRGPIAPARAAWLAKEVALAVAAGHAQGVPHGRLNPEAVLVTHSGAVKLIGYVVDASLHRPGPVSPVYGELDPLEADVIDVAAVLYAALTGRWAGVAPSSVPDAPLEGRTPLRPRQVRAGVPRALDAICERVLQREASRHELPLESAHEVAAALADFTGEPLSGSPVVAVVDLHGDSPVAMSQAALAEEARQRSQPLPAVTGPETGPETSTGTDTGAGTDEERTQMVATAPADAPDGATQTLPRPEVPGTDPATSAVPGAATGAAAATATAAGANGPSGPTSGPAMEATALHREPLEGPDTLSPLRAPDEVPPPPPFEDSPERPLFSTTERRVPASTLAAQEAARESAATEAERRRARADAAATQLGTAVPGGPGPGEPDGFWPEEPAPAAGNGREGRGWLRTAIVVGVLLAVGVAMVAAFSLGRGAGLPLVGDSGDGGGETSAEPAQPQSVTVAGVSDFDPLGDQEENSDQAADAVDGDPATAWSTVTYYNRPDLGGLKEGVGLLLDLGEDQEVGEISVRFGTEPTSFEVYAAPEGSASAPTSLDGASLVGGQDDAPAQATVRLQERPTTRYLVLWLTNLPSAPGGFQGLVAEVNLRS